MADGCLAKITPPKERKRSVAEILREAYRRYSRDVCTRRAVKRILR
jgi:hypothetical protein